MAESLSFVQDPFFYSVLLPFILVFAVFYAILEKTEVLGKNKRMVNLIVSFCIGFIFIGVPHLVGVALDIIPIFALAVIILLCLLLLFGFAGIKVEDSKALKATVGIVLALALIGIVLYATGVFSLLTSATLSNSVINMIVFGVLIIIIILVVVLGGQGKKPESSS